MAAWPVLVTEKITSRAATVAQKANNFCALIFCNIADPAKRPIIAPNQYTEM